MRLPIQVEAIIFRRKGGTIEYLLLKRLPERNGFWQPVKGGLARERDTRKSDVHGEPLENRDKNGAFEES